MDNIKEYNDALNEYKSRLEKQIEELTNDVSKLLEDEKVVEYLNKIYCLQQLNIEAQYVNATFSRKIKDECTHPMLFVEYDLNGKICTCALCRKYSYLTENQMMDLYKKKRLIAKKKYDVSTEKEILVPLENYYGFIDDVRKRYTEIYSQNSDKELSIEDLLWDSYCNNPERKRK